VLSEEGIGFGEVVPQAGAFKNLAGFLLDVSSLVAPDQVEHLADVGNDVVGVAFVVYKDAIEGDGDGVVGRKVSFAGGREEGDGVMGCSRSVAFGVWSSGVIVVLLTPGS